MNLVTKVAEVAKTRTDIRSNFQTMEILHAMEILHSNRPDCVVLCGQ